MKTLITAVALAAVIASPALAQTAARRAPAQQALSQDQSFGRTEAQRRATNSGHSVYEGGQYLGADPDPNVRLMLRLDYEHRDF